MTWLKPGIEVPEAPLAQSREHHEAMGSSGGSSKPEEYKTPMAALMSDEELRTYMLKQLQTVRDQHAKLNNDRLEMFRMIRDKFLLSNLKYLAEIERLPNGFDIEAIEEELTVPEGVE